jgi:hypothetical protein
LFLQQTPQLHAEYWFSCDAPTIRSLQALASADLHVKLKTRPGGGSALLRLEAGLRVRPGRHPKMRGISSNSMRISENAKISPPRFSSEQIHRA